MAKAPVWATLGRLEKRERNRNIEWKKIEKNVRVPKKIGKKYEGTKNKIGDKSAIPKKVQNLQYPKKCNVSIKLQWFQKYQKILRKFQIYEKKL